MVNEISLNKLGFYGDGFTIIKNAYEQYGVRTVLILKISYSCTDTGSLTDLPDYTLQLDNLEISYGDACIISAGFEQNNATRKLKALFDSKHDILKSVSPSGQMLPGYDALPTEIELPSRPIVLVTKAVSDPCIDNDYGFDNNLSLFAGDTATQAISFLFLVKTDGLATFQGINTLSGTLFPSPLAYELQISSGAFLNLQPTFVFEASEFDCLTSPAVMALQITMTGTLTNSNDPVPMASHLYNCGFWIFHFDEDDNFLFKEQLQAFNGDYLNSPVVGNVSINYSKNFSVNPGDKFYLLLMHDTVADADTNISLRYTDYTFSWDASVPTTCPTTYANVVPVNEAFSRLTNNIAGINSISEFFGRLDSQPYDHNGDGCGSLLAITSGILLRMASDQEGCSEDGAVIDGVQPSINLSLKDLFEAMDCLFGIGMAVETTGAYSSEDVLRIEDIRYFFQPVEIAAFTDVKDLKVNVIDDMIFGKAQFGYSKSGAETSGSDIENGRDEIFGTREYVTQNTNVINTYRKVCDFIASGFCIEEQRRAGKSTSSAPYDGDIFLIGLDRFYSGLTHDLPTIATDKMLVTSNILNVRYTPWRNALRHYRFLRTIGADRIFFASGTGNVAAETQIVAPVDDCILEQQTSLFAENAGISQNTFKPGATDFRTPVLRPEEISFECGLSMAQFEAIRANPHGLIRVTQGGLDMSGYIKSIVFEMTKGLAKFTLLRKWS